MGSFELQRMLCADAWARSFRIGFKASASLYANLAPDRDAVLKAQA